MSDAVTHAQVVAQARTWIGTPFHHQARLKGVGVDCAGLVIGVARDLGLVQQEFDVTSYPRTPDGSSLMAYLHEHMVALPPGAELRPGHVVCVRFAVDPQHLGILGDYRAGVLSIIHAAARSNAVIEQRLMYSRAMQFVAAFALPGVEG
jgi:cell wall-associated NlpC family hydrolase